MDYTSNSDKDKSKQEKPKKKIEKVISGDVVVHKKSLGRKAKGLFVEADFKGVVRYIVSDVLLPAARNTIVDASTKGIERMMYGEAANRRRSFNSGPRITYNNPVSRGYGSSVPAPAPSGRRGLVPGESRSPRHSRDDLVLSSKDEAERVLERMNDIIDTYEVVSVADLNELVGLPTSYMDNKWGWIYLGDVQVRQIREGFLIDLPSAEPIQ